VHIVVGKVRCEEFVEQLLHLWHGELLAGLDGALASKRHRNAFVLVISGAHKLRTVGQLIDHFAERALGVEVTVRIRHRVHDHGVSAEGLDFE
ncbi:uncharacterized protein METZ01_LOCUS435270, partial [marine metagenome]